MSPLIVTDITASTLVIIGDPIEQVRSPEMFTTIFAQRGVNAIMLPVHVRPADFDAVVANLKKIPNLGGLVFTIPYKGRACGFADELGAQAQVAGVINALGRGKDGVWRGDIFDGLGCVEAFRRRGQSFKGKSVMLIGSGGAGSAIAVAVAYEGPRACASPMSTRQKRRRWPSASAVSTNRSRSKSDQSSSTAPTS